MYKVTEIECPGCDGEGVIFIPSPVPYLESDQPCGRCMGLGIVERLAWNAPETPENALLAASQDSDG